MDRREIPPGAPEVLELGRDRPPARYGLAVTVGVLSLGLGAALGFSLGHQDPPESTAAPVLLSVGAVTENPDLFGSARYLVPVHNLGAREVTIERLAVGGWSPVDSLHESIDIQPDGWQSVPLAVTPLCEAPGQDPRSMVVRGTVEGRAFQREVTTYESLEILASDWSVRCFGPVGRAPTRDQLPGTWLVRNGEHLPGMILLHFDRGGQVVIDDGMKSMVHESERVVGRWTLTGSRLAVVADTGSHCSLGARWAWEAGLEHGFLHLHLLGDGGPGCRRDLDRVWVAERVGP